MPRKSTTIIAGTTLAVLGVAWVAYGGVDMDRRIPARPGDTLAADIVLGSGFAFDKGSLEIASHAANDVRVVVDTTGWGEYAVDVEVRESRGGVRVVGRVDGALHWMFGGPTVDVRVWVPQSYSVDARIDGGPLLLEDLTGRVTARVEDSDLTLRRVEGVVRLVSREGEIRAEDSEGALDIESQDGEVSVSGTRGDVKVRTHSGNVRVVSVNGAVDVAAERNSIEIERVRGLVRAASERGGIDVTNVEGALEAETNRGRIQVEELEGPLRARSSRGSIDVEFVTDPSGTIVSERGSITVEAPGDAEFDLDARTDRGRIDLDSDFAFTVAPPEPEAHAHLEDPAQAYAELGREIAAHVTTQVHAQLERGLRTGDWTWDWDWNHPSHSDWETESEMEGESEWNEARDSDDAARNESEPEDADENRAHGEDDWGWGHWGDDHEGRAPFGRRAQQLAGTVNGGGEPLHIRTARGSIHIEER